MMLIFTNLRIMMIMIACKLHNIDDNINDNEFWDSCTPPGLCSARGSQTPMIIGVHALGNSMLSRLYIILHLLLFSHYYNYFHYINVTHTAPHHLATRNKYYDPSESEMIGSAWAIGW